MSERDRKRFDTIKIITQMPNQYVQAITEYMDRKGLNPDWFAMSDEEIVSHMTSVVNSFADSVELKVLLNSFPQVHSKQDKFEKEWMKSQSDDSQ